MAQEPQGAYEQVEYDSLGGCLCFCDRGFLVLLSAVIESAQFGQC